jgi:hypothetical protein
MADSQRRAMGEALSKTAARSVEGKEASKTSRRLMKAV